MSKAPLDPAVKKFFEDIGRKNGKALYAKHGPDYFKRISAMRKKHGRQKLNQSEPDVSTPTNEDSAPKL